MSSIVDTPYSTLTQPTSGWQLFKTWLWVSLPQDWHGRIRLIGASSCYGRLQLPSPPLAC